MFFKVKDEGNILNNLENVKYLVVGVDVKGHPVGEGIETLLEEVSYEYKSIKFYKAEAHQCLHIANMYQIRMTPGFLIFEYKELIHKIEATELSKLKGVIEDLFKKDK